MARKPQTRKSATRKPAAVKPKPETKPDKTKKATPAAAAKAAVGHNSADPKLRELFLQHKPKIDRLKEAAASASGKLRAALKEAKADGFSKAQFDIARQLSTPEGEAEFRAELAGQVAAAMYIGSDIGGLLGQLDLFGPSRTDASERAYDEGQKASMENRQAKPDYAPGTAQYEAYMKGFHDHQAGITAGFQSTDPGAKTKAQQKREAKAAAPAGAPPADKPADPPADAPPPVSEPPPAPPSGQVLSRAEYNRLKAAEESGQPQSQFSQRN